MKEGSLKKRYLSEAVFKNIQNNELPKPFIGMDYSNTANDIVTADGQADSPYVAFRKALNNFACSFGTCRFARISMLLPVKTKESNIDSYMKEISSIARDENIQIVGGDSKVVSYIERAHFTVTVIGQRNPEYEIDKKKIKSGYYIVVSGFAGMLGTNRLIEEKSKVLKGRFVASFLDDALYKKESLAIETVSQIVRDNNLIKDCNICYSHDASEGGIYHALWELGEWVNKGMLIDNKAIPIRQETIEVCETLDLNPYMIDGTGSVIFVCEKATPIVDALNAAGIPASVIGHITDAKERLVRITKEEYRKLEE